MSNFSKKATQGNKDSQQELLNERGYPRDNRDNPYFKEIQVKDISKIITDDCKFYWDFDTAIFQACSVQDENSIKVTCEIDGSVEYHKTRTEWKGRARTEGVIGESSKLGIKNIKRIADGLEPFEISDHKIEDIKVLKKGCGLDNVKSKIRETIAAVKFQFGIDNVVLLLGQGDVFRNLLPLPEEYKGCRKGTARPTLLKEGREWLVAEMGAIVEYAEGTETCLENDDICSIHGQEGYLHFLKHGKFSKVQIGFDKDDWQGNCLYLNYHMKGVHFKIPQAILIENTAKGVGTIEMYEDEAKCSGLLQICKQMLCGDSSDHYHPRLRFTKEIQPKGDYADISFFKEFFNVKDCTVALQQVVDKFQEWYPKGLKYKDFRGGDIDCDTMSWANVMFLCVYMKRTRKDSMDFYKLCDAFKVDYSHLVGNNVEKLLPFKEDSDLRDEVKNTTTQIEDIISILEDKSGKVADKNERKQIAIDMLTDMKDLGNMFQQ